mmetsp:Transcript_253/g.551  ORF Transcript_253/g.551 Transcript_253/m.551 type:complete len:107 (-) Transcript_253:623-943(-)
MWIYVPGETQRSVMQRLGARKGGKIGVVKLERAQNDTAARSIQIFFSHVSRYLNSDDSFDDAIFLMTGVDIGELLFMIIQRIYLSKMHSPNTMCSMITLLFPAISV